MRCSACASKGKFDLFFCSTEHQKLVWRFHRLVCGERSHPFRLPPFSREEADLLLQRLSQAPTESKEAELQSQFLKVLEDEELRGPDLKSKVEQLVGQECAIACMHSASGPTRMEYLVRSIRTFSADWYSELRANPLIQPMPHIEGFVKDYDHFTVHNKFPIPTDTLWFSTFCHRLGSHLPIIKQIEDAIAKQGRLTRAQDKLFELKQQSFGSLLRFLECSKDPDRAAFCLVTISQVQTAYKVVVVV
ncbi:hypothetical protein JCM10908_000081 [Rhodotorula pacifica]|uniref:uncharacterized protein n=1 Tax=Rhodotorula pacifica TaxID=1495444 RepID=UPI00317F57D2